MISLVKDFNQYVGNSFTPEETLKKALISDEAKLLGWKQASIETEKLFKEQVDTIFIEEDGFYGVWKEPIFSGLIFNQIVRGGIGEHVTELVEGGGVSTAFCMNKLSKVIKEEVTFVTSRFYPDRLISKLVSDKVNTIIVDENKSLKIEEEFYSFVVSYIKKKRALCAGSIASPWHVKWSGFIGQKYADYVISNYVKYFSTLDFIVISVGSGATLSFAASLKKYFPKLKIVVAEPEEAKLVAEEINFPPFNVSSCHYKTNVIYNDYTDKADPRIVHRVFGPHYEALNPKIRASDLSYIDIVCHYSKNDWQLFSSEMRSKNRPVGNTSSAGLFVATELKRKFGSDKQVLSVIYDPLMSYAIEDVT